MGQAAAAIPIDVMQAPVARLDAQLLVQSVNGRMGALLGDEAVGAFLLDRLSRASTPCGLNVFRFEGDAGSRWFRLDLHLADDETFAVLTDITQERQALEDLRYASAARDVLMKQAEVGAWRYDPDAEVYYFSEELSLGHGQSPTGVSLPVMELIEHPDDVAVDAAIRERLIREGGRDEAELRFRGADGGWRHLRVQYQSGRPTPSGKYEMFGLSQNITRQAEARDEARTAAHRLRLALTAAKAGVIEYDYQTKTYWLSTEFQTLAGVERIPEGIDPLVLFHEDDRHLAEALRVEAMAGQGGAVDVRLSSGAAERWVRFYLEIERDAADEPLRAICFVIDIDVQKRQELALAAAMRLAEAATAAKSNFLALVSHEIRTPLNGVVGVLNLLGREQLSLEGRGLLEEALGCSDMLATIINDVLDFSKIEAGKLELSPEPSCARSIAEGVVRLLRPQAADKGVDLRLDAEVALGTARFDPIRFRQCLFNLIGNAVKFTDSGVVQVRLSSRALNGARLLHVEVQDTGVGVPEAAKPTLFDRFQQADSGTTRKFGGTGLGLSISRQLVRMMGGDLDFHSVEGQGSTFWFDIPAPLAEPGEAAETASFSTAPLLGLRVLVVDDNRTNRLIAEKTLQALGAAAECVASGGEAITAVTQTDYDLVLMDINMPEMDGREATRRIRALPGAAGQTPVIALTADIMSHQLQSYVAAGMNGVAPKPFSPAQLLKAIAALADEPAFAAQA